MTFSYMPDESSPSNAPLLWSYLVVHSSLPHASVRHSSHWRAIHDPTSGTTPLAIWLKGSGPTGILPRHPIISDSSPTVQGRCSQGWIMRQHEFVSVGAGSIHAGLCGPCMLNGMSLRRPSHASRYRSLRFDQSYRPIVLRSQPVGRCGTEC